MGTHPISEWGMRSERRQNPKSHLVGYSPDMALNPMIIDDIDVALPPSFGLQQLTRAEF
jgi:hypothetical protein